MNKTKIEWCDYVINPVKGLCPMHCKDNFGKEYCYSARPNGLYKRFKWNPEIRYTDPGFTIAELQTIKKPSRIFWGSTMELFYDWPEIWLRDTFTIIRQFPQHTHIFLTKRPENLIKWSPFPPNVWVGVSATNDEQYFHAVENLCVIQASVKFVSFEPLLAPIFHGIHTSINWVIIGQQTPYSPKTAPPKEWIDGIIDAADKVGIPVFLKENLRPLFETSTGIVRGNHWVIKNNNLELRQEFPRVKK